jgi:xylulokinase
VSFLVVDIGTSSCKAAVVSADGEITSISRSPMHLDDQSPPFAEADCDLIWHAVRQVIGRVAVQNRGIGIDAVGVSSILGYVFLDRSNRPLAPAVLYADNRAVEQVKEILKIIPPEVLAAKLLWLKKNRPEMEHRIQKVIGLKDEIIRRLTGVVATDLAHANYTMLFNVSKGEFDAGLMRELRLDEKKLFPEPAFADRVVGRLSRAAAGKVGLKEGIPVVLGSSDGTTAMYGGGIHEKDKAVLVSGTTDVLMMLAETYPDDPDPALNINSGRRPGEFLVGGATGLSGGAVSRFEDLFNRTLDELEPRIAELPPGSGGLLVFPGLTGERAPYWRETLTGALCGLTLRHGPENIFRALIEGTGFRLRRLIKAFKKSGLRPEAIKVTGGLGGVDLVNRIRAHVTGVEMVRMAQLESTCLGTAVFCKSGLMGGDSVFEIAREWGREAQRFVPDFELTEKYDKLAGLFERYIQSTAGLHRDLLALG